MIKAYTNVIEKRIALLFSIHENRHPSNICRSSMIPKSSKTNSLFIIVAWKFASPLTKNCSANPNLSHWSVWPEWNHSHRIIENTVCEHTSHRTICTIRSWWTRGARQQVSYPYVLQCAWIAQQICRHVWKIEQFTCLARAHPWCLMAALVVVSSNILCNWVYFYNVNAGTHSLYTLPSDLFMGCLLMNTFPPASVTHGDTDNWRQWRGRKRTFPLNIESVCKYPIRQRSLGAVRVEVWAGACHLKRKPFCSLFVYHISDTFLYSVFFSSIFYSRLHVPFFSFSFIQRPHECSRTSYIFTVLTL